MQFTEKDAIQIVAEHYNLDADTKALPGEIDRNFLLTTKPDRSLRPVRFVISVLLPIRNI